MGKKANDLTGKRYGALTVIRRAERKYKNDTHAFWLCECDCGKSIVTNSSNISAGRAKSCGCMNNITHGMTGTRLYHIWQDMKDRCYNPHNVEYCYYGAEGKTVCTEWHDFQTFYDWAVSNGYHDGLTIDRIDGKQGYSPENCRWATRKEQSNNTRRSHYVEYNGRIQTLSQWAEELGIDYDKLFMRLKRGWSVDRAFKTK